jgi:predicted  nucleic acid-binding Zn-ribbon protein
MTMSATPTTTVLEAMQALEGRLAQLLKAQAALREQVRRLEASNESLQKSLAEKNQLLKDFQYQLEIRKIVGSVTEGQGNREELSHKLDRYIKEIDECINFLNQEP